MEAQYVLEGDNINKKDRKKLTIQTKLNKINESFINDKDGHYRNSLQTLKINLSTIHNGTNPELLEELKDLEEQRDFELLELKLMEEYQVQMIKDEFYKDIEKSNSDHDEMVKLVKEKLFANLEKQIKQLKEDKILLDMANSHSYSMQDTTLNTDFHKNTRSSTINNNNVYLSDSRRARRIGNGYISSTQHEDSHGQSANESGNNSAGGSKRRKQYNSSNDDTLLSDAGNLSSILQIGNKDKASTRHSSKTNYVAPNGLKTEEVTEDLNLFKSLNKKVPVKVDVPQPLKK